MNQVVLEQRVTRSFHSFIALGPASFAQERIYLDQQVRFSSGKRDGHSVAAYNELTVLRVATGELSVARLRRALRWVLAKHPTLRTSLDFDPTEALLIQRIRQHHETFDFAPERIFDNDDQLDLFLGQLNRDPSLFDLARGHVFYCQLLRQQLPNQCSNNDLLTAHDVIVTAFHHAAFDRSSRQIFFQDLSVVYNREAPLAMDVNALQYIDYSTHERQLDMTTSHDFWRAQLDGYDLERGLVLPFDRHRLSTNERSGRPCIVDFTLSEQLTRSFLAYASSQSVTPFQLGLAVFYAFLFKLSNGQQDLCIASINANRYRAELRDIIGMFVATLPYRIQLDSSATFKQLVGQVRDLCLSILEHSHYPLQRIIGSQHTPAFLETMFDFITVTPDIERVDLDGAVLEPVSSEKVDHVAKFDMMLTFVHNPSTGMSFSLICSQDLFDQSTVQTLADRFSCLLHRLFDSTAMTVTKQSLCQLSIILPKEEPLIHSLKHNGINRLQAPYSTINELFNQQALSQPQKLSVELDEQSLTYSELFFYAQQLALRLINRHDVKAGDIVCQCVERSLSMVRLMRTTSLL